MNDPVWKASLACAAGIYGAYAYMGMRTPLPGAVQDTAEGLTIEGHEVTTEDGAILRLKRYANPGAQPVLLCHGFGSCGTSMDLPREGRNMATWLARDGFDVWVSSWRGCGHDPYACECPDWSHSIDDLAVYDAPALVDAVTSATGKRALYIGHSMGGEILYMYLQGVRFEDGHVVSEDGLVRRHHEKLAGGVTIGSPPAFWYPDGHPYHYLFGTRAARAVLSQALGEMLRREYTSPRVYRIGGRKGALDEHPRVMMAVSRSPMLSFTYCRGNTDKDATTSLARWGTGDVSAGMWVQLLQALLEGDMLEHPGRSEPDRRYSYTANMSTITLPIFFLTGDKDFANPGAIERFGYDGISSERKEYVNLAGYGHTDLLMGRNVEREVYPLLSAWMKATAAP